MAGEWIRGKFGVCEVVGFIVKETYGSIHFIVKTVNPLREDCPIPRNITFGSVHTVAKSVFSDYFVKLDTPAQLDMVAHAMKIKDKQWLEELSEDFFNPFPKELFKKKAKK